VKTLLVSTLSQSLELGFSTSSHLDLMPPAVIQHGRPEVDPETTGFALSTWPLFSNMVLADEITGR
jgi:MoxR-like ATPase